ncbi:MAG TPA: N-acetyltransferase [Jiangellaceae bacterium]
MTIRRYDPSDRDALYAICLKTGASGDDATDLYLDPQLLGEVYVGPYVEYGPELAFVVEDAEGVAGYVLGALDTRAFEARCEATWWPPLRARYPVGHFPPGSADARLLDVVHRPHAAPDDVVRDYPSHLHVDLLPRTQGQGYGRALIERLLGALHEAGSPAVHLGVGEANQRAIGFYERMGFTLLRQSTHGRTLGRSTVV